MQRLNPTVLAAIALLALILLIAGVILLQRRGSEDDRLTGEEIATTREDAEGRCADRRTYDLIKREIFRRAAAVRGSGGAAFEQLAGYSTVRMEAPVLRDENRTDGTLTCNGTLTLDLAPGVAVAGGRRSLTGDILYTVQSGEGGGVTVTDADDIIAQLATLARIAEPAEDPLTNMTNELVADPLTPVGGLPIDPLAPQPQAPRATASPSFNCANARSRGEIAVCNDEGLAALDRQMAAQFASAMSEADPEQRAILASTRNAFLRFRNQCPNSNCIADTYRGRMREIEAIMTGEWEAR